MSGDWTLNVSELTNSRIGNFVCGLQGPSHEEAIRLLTDLQVRLMKYGSGQVSGPLDRVLGLKPLKGVPHHFEKRGPTVRIYVSYTSGRKLKIINGGLKKTQDADIERLKNGLEGPRRGRRRPRTGDQG